MKNWILNHKKLYFFIVGVIAFVAFMAITLHGVKRASAATETVTANIKDVEQEVTVYDIFEVDWIEWATSEDALSHYEVPSALVNKIVSECTQMIVKPYNSSDGGLVYYFLKDAIYEPDVPMIGQRSLYIPSDSSYCITVSFASGTPKVQSVVGCYDYGENVANIHIMYYLNGNHGYCVGSTYDFLVNVTHENAKKVTRNNLIYPVIADYIYDLDYTFDDVYYRQTLNVDNVPIWTLYFDREPDILYPSLQNYYIDVSYRFVLPSLDLLQDFAEMGDVAWSYDAVNLWRFSGNYKRTYDYQASYLAPQGFITLDDLLTNLRNDWRSFYGTALDEELLYLAVRYAYPQVTAITYREIGTDGNYHMGQTAVLQSYEYYSKLWNGLITPSVLKNVAANTHGVSLDYIIPLADVNSKNDYDELLNQYQHEVDKNKEFEQALKDAQSEVQRAEEALKKAHEDMGLSGFLGVFDTISKGFEAASGAVTNVASAIGNVFSFLPSEITACLYFVFVFLLFVAIYHGLKG